MGLDRPTLRKSIGSLPRAAWLLFVGTFINRFGSFVLVFLAVYIVRAGYTAAEAGLALSAYGIGSLLSAPAGGHLADRLGRRNAIATSMFSSAVALLALSQAAALAMILPLSGLVGFTAELYRPAASALLADLTPAGQRVPAFAMYRLAANLGFAAGPAVGGLLVERSFFILFLGDALTASAFGTLALLLLPEGERRSPRFQGSGWVQAALADRGFLLFLAASTCGGLVIVQAFSSFALQVTDRLSGAAYGTLMSLNGLLVVLLELPIAGVTQRLRPRPVMAVGLALMGLGFGMTILAAAFPLFALTVVVWSLGEVVYMPVAGAYVADVAPYDMRGRFQGAWGLTFGAALVLGPPLGTSLYALSPAGLWLGCLAIGLLAAALVLAGPKAHARVAGPGEGPR